MYKTFEITWAYNDKPKVKHHDIVRAKDKHDARRMFEPSSNENIIRIKEA